MQILALAADYDSTLADHGVLAPSTLAALRRFKATGRRVVLVTGRELPDLRALLPDLTIFDFVVAENGALLFNPSTGDERCLAAPPPAQLVQRLRERGVAPLSIGRAIVATWEPHQSEVLAAIRDLGLELTVIFNKGAIMVLPTGINKATGLAAALRELDVSHHAVVAVGDAENDSSFLHACGHAAAVANATPALRAGADSVLTLNHGHGVEELIERVLRSDPALREAQRHALAIGQHRDGSPAWLAADEGHVLVVGPSRCGKSTFATALTESMYEQQYEFCVLDPEGDYDALRHAVSVGSLERPPEPAHLDDLLHDAGVNVVIQLRAMMPEARLALIDSLWPKLVALRARAGRPEWIVVDEAHQTFRRGTRACLPKGMSTAVLLTLDPGALSHAVLSQVQTVIALGPTPAEVIAAFCDAADLPLPRSSPMQRAGEALLWRPESLRPPVPFVPRGPSQPHQRHSGKYADGNVGAARSFYFRGPHSKLNRPARNLFEFLRLGSELGDDVWLHHLRAGDYGRWFRQVIGDEQLGACADNLMRGASLSAEQTRAALRQAVLRRYQPPTR